MIKVICKQCNKEFLNYPSNHRQFCSMECRNKSYVGKPTWNKGMGEFRSKIGIESFRSKMKGRHLSEEHKKKIKFSSKKCVKNKGRIKKGQKLSENTKKRISKKLKGKIPKNFGINFGFIGDKAPNWKGDNVGYGGLHAWVKRFLGKPTKCEHCGKDGLTSKQIHWANKDHKYRRVFEDYVRLCASCHKKYDIKYNLQRATNF